MSFQSKSRHKVSIITLGCSKNLADSEVLGGQLKASNIPVVHEDKKMDHDTVIINTCGFIDKAKQESVNAILEQVALKNEGRLRKVYVTGCLSERYREELREEIPEVDGWFGSRELPQLLHAFRADYRKELVGERLSATPPHYAYLKISEGCNRTCAFCAIPLIRGSHVSRPIDEIITQAKAMVDQGVKEVMVIAQELTYYGLDLYKKRMIAELLDKLAGQTGLEWIRLHYAYPRNFPLEILDVMAAHDNICNYLDIPVQHGSDRMLKAMKRQITREEMTTLLQLIRQRVPGINLRTTLIAGFPGETEQDVEELKSFMKEIRFERAGIFTYSHEENTFAGENLIDGLSQQEKEARAEDIMDLQREISGEINESRVGKIMKVIIDRREQDVYIGRTEYDSVEVDNEVIVHPSSQVLHVGDFVNVKIEKASDFDLEGSVCDI